MKKKTSICSLFTLAGLALTSGAGHAAILFQENFNYAPGDLVANSGGVWEMDNAQNTLFTLQDAGWGTGMAVKTEPVTNGNQRARTTVDLTGYTNSTVYVSMWVDVLTVPAANGGNGSDNGGRYVAAGLWNGPGIANPNTEMVYFGKRSSAVAGWGIFNPGTNTDSSVSPHGIDGPTQIVLRIDFDSAGNETQRLYALDVNNIPGVEPAVADATFAGYNFLLPENNVIDLRFSSGGNNGGANPNANWGMWDNFGVYTEWSDLAAINAGNVVIPEPGSVLLLAGGAAGLLGRRRRVN